MRIQISFTDYFMEDDVNKTLCYFKKDQLFLSNIVDIKWIDFFKDILPEFSEIVYFEDKPECPNCGCEMSPNGSRGSKPNKLKGIRKKQYVCPKCRKTHLTSLEPFISKYSNYSHDISEKGRTEYMEHIGTGITRMRKEMEKSRLPEPEFEDGFYFKVVLRGPKGKLILPQNAVAEDYEGFNLKDRQVDALLKMENEEVNFTYNSYMEQYNISKSTAKRDLRYLEEQKLIRKLMIDKQYYFFV